MVYGTKAGNESAHYIKPNTLKELFDRIKSDLGDVHFHKPIPGMCFTKRHNPLNDMDRPIFRSLPPQIIITQPPRLYRTTAWKYKKRFYMNCECFWEFEYSFEFQWSSENKVETRMDWMSPYVLNAAYWPSTCVPDYNRIKNQQLQLF